MQLIYNDHLYSFQYNNLCLGLRENIHNMIYSVITAGIGLRELLSSDAVQNFIYGPTINAEKAIYQPGALRKVRISFTIVLDYYG